MKFKLRPIFKDVSLTFITEIVVLIGMIFIYKLIAKNFGPEGLGKYSLVRRVVSFFYPFFLLGIGIGLPRFISMSKDKNQRSCYIKVGVTVVIGCTLIFITITNLFKEFFSRIFLGHIDYTNLVFPFSILLLGLILHFLIYSYFCGRLFVKTFNLLQAINLAIAPLVILLIFNNISIEKIIVLIGITTITIGFIFSLFFIKEFVIPVAMQQLNKSLKELLRYSIPRVPGVFAWIAFFSLGPIFAGHLTSIKEVGYLSVSQSLLFGLGGVVTPLSIILLPKVSSLISQGKQKTIKENVNLLISATLQCSIYMCAQLMVFSDAIIKYWLGSEFFNAIPVMRIVLISITFYAFHVAMRGILDAVKVKPLNAINISISLGIFLLLAGISFFFKSLPPIISLSIAFTSGLMCLGVLTYMSVRKIYPENPKVDLRYLWIAIVVNILLGSLAKLTKSFIISKFYYLIVFEIILVMIYLSILWLLKMDWLRAIPKLIKIESSPFLVD